MQNSARAYVAPAMVGRDALVGRGLWSSVVFASSGQVFDRFHMLTGRTRGAASTMLSPSRSPEDHRRALRGNCEPNRRATRRRIIGSSHPHRRGLCRCEKRPSQGGMLRSPVRRRQGWPSQRIGVAGRRAGPPRRSRGPSARLSEPPALADDNSAIAQSFRSRTPLRGESESIPLLGASFFLRNFRF